MWLEYRTQLASAEYFAQTQYALFDFCGVVCIIAQEDNAVILQLEVEAAIHSAERQHSAAYFFRRSSCNLCQSHGGNAVVNVDADGNAQFHILDVFKRRYKVEDDTAVTDA